MSSNYKYGFTRHIKQGRTSTPCPVTAMLDMTTEAYNALVASPWIAVDTQDSRLPKHKWDQTGLSDAYDAAKYCGDYSSSNQHSYACAACYTVKLPADAIAGTVAKIESIAATIYGDRWLAEGAIVSVHLSTSQSPPSWDDVLVATYATDPSSATYDPPLYPQVRSNSGPDCSTELSLEIGGVGSTVEATRYMHIVIRLADYISVPQIAIEGGGTKDSAWVEGGAMIDGTTISIVFDRVVTADPEVIEVLEPYSISEQIPYNQGFWNNSSTINNQIQNSFDYLLESGIRSDLVAGDFVRLSLSSRESAGSYQGVSEISSDQELDQVFNGVLASPVATPQIGYQRILSDLVGGQKLCRHSISGGFFSRGGYFTEYGTPVYGLSFENAIEAVENSPLILRVSMFVLDGILPYASYESDGSVGITCNTITRESAFDPEVIFGSATTIKLNYTDRRGQSLLASSIIRKDAEFNYTSQSITVQPLGYFDFLASEGVTAEAKIPFSSGYVLKRHNVFFVSISVIGIVDTSSEDYSQVANFTPGKFYLHKD